MAAASAAARVEEEYRYVPRYWEIYQQRKETIEWVFADVKEKHVMRYATMRGLAKIRMQVTLTFTCMNLKKLPSGKRGQVKYLLALFVLYIKMMWNIRTIFCTEENMA